MQVRNPCTSEQGAPPRRWPGQEEVNIDQAIQRSTHPWWMFMGRTTGSTIYNTLEVFFPVLLTGLVFVDERKTAIYGIIVTKKKRGVYFLSKALSVFFVTLLNSLCLFLLNLVLVTLVCPSNTEISSIFIPKAGTLAAYFYEKSPLSEAAFYIALHALEMALLSVFYLTIHMIAKPRNKFLAFVLPPLMMYVLNYITERVNHDFSLSFYPAALCLGGRHNIGHRDPSLYRDLWSTLFHRHHMPFHRYRKEQGRSMILFSKRAIRLVPLFLLYMIAILCVILLYALYSPRERDFCADIYSDKLYCYLLLPPFVWAVSMIDESVKKQCHTHEKQNAGALLCAVSAIPICNPVSDCVVFLDCSIFLLGRWDHLRYRPVFKIHSLFIQPVFACELI